MKKSALIHPKIERILRQIILKDLANKGRPKWDKPHTEAVVHWMKHLLVEINNPQINPKVMITAAYAHDWGYAQLFDLTKPVSINDSRSQKDLHMKRSQHMIERLIYERMARYFSAIEVLRITHLVSVHDYPDKLKDEDEILLMECDTLGMVDVDHVKPTLTKKDNQRFLQNSILKKRLPKFIHPPAKDIAQELITQREKYYQDLEK